MSTFADFGIELPSNATGNVKALCPECSGTRRNSKDRCLSVDVDRGIWKCHHCGWSGALKQEPSQQRRYRRPEPRPQIALPQNALEWFRSRGITEAVLARNRIDYGRIWFPQTDKQEEAIIFPYFRAGEEINRKYRTFDKHFRMEQGCELTLYGLDDIREELVWVEGEMDKLALEVAGLQSVVSVPNGAPAPNTKDLSSKLTYLEADEERVQRASKHIIAVDSDGPGNRLESELARRLGPEKCSRVQWPAGCKDANDVLMKHGPDDLRWFIENAQPFPIEGVFEIRDRREDLVRLYEQGFESGQKTGWRDVDKLYTVRPGEVTIITGIPSSGKSNWLDCLLVNLARLHGWNFALFSPENLPLEQHMSAIMEKYIGRPFHHPWAVRMTEGEFTTAMGWVQDHFAWIMPSDDKDWNIDTILGAASQLCFRRGINGLVIDPYNELEAFRPAGASETEYIGQFLKRVRVFARQRRIHIWVVVHPAKLYREKGELPIPTLYDCAGSAHWRNKSDNGICVWRDLSQSDTREVQIHVQKIRFRHVGQRGMAKLLYDGVCATYSEEQEQKEWTQ